MVERFNGRISDVLATRRYVSGEDLEQTLKRYCWLYNHHIPQKVLHHQSPIAAMKEWQAKRLELFTKRVVNHTGPDNQGTPMATPKNTSVIKAFQILNAFTHAGEKLTLSQLARKLDMNIATAHRFLNTLQLVGAIVKTPDGSFELGLLLADLGGRVSVFDAMHSITQPHVEELVAQFGETIHAAILDKDMVCYVAKDEGARSLTIITRMGARLPAYCTGLGKALLSMLPQEEQERYAHRQLLKRYTENTITNPQQLLEELRLVRDRGYSLDNEEMESGLCCVAVPIKGRDNQVNSAISLSAPSTRLNNEKIIEIAQELKAHAAKIGEKLASQP